MDSWESKTHSIKNYMQALGGAITYARRYALSAMVGITQDDDDGNTAVGKPPKPTQDNNSDIAHPSHWKFGD